MNIVFRPLFLAALLSIALLAGCSDDETTTGGTPPDTTPPAVTSVNPVDVNHMDIVFNEDLNRDSAEHHENYVILEIATPFQSIHDAVAPGDTLRVGSASLGTDKRTVTLSTIDPMNTLDYELSVTGVKDASGNTITTASTRTFTGTTNPDVTAPELVSRSPAPNATGVGISQAVTFQFSEPVNYSSVAGGVTWTGGGGDVPFLLENSNSTSFALIPDAPLDTGTPYTVTLTGVMDFSSNVMATTGWSFTTTNTTDTTPPTVVSTVPANNATYVNVNSNLSITFSEPVNQVTFQAQLSPDVGDGIDTWSNGGKTVTFDPDAPLASNQPYTLTVLPGGFEDLAGNKNAQIVNVVFSTGATLPAGSFAGTISGDPGTAAADPSGAFVGAADRLIFDNDNLNILGSDVVAGNNSYDIGHLPDDVYYPLCVMNTNGDNELDPTSGDAVGLYGINFGTGDLEPDSVIISGGNRVTGVSFPLYDMSAIAGTITYHGAYAGGFYDLYVGVFATAGFDPTNDPDYATYAYWPGYPEFAFNSLDDGLADGTYYVGAYLDQNGNGQYDPATDPAGCHGGGTPAQVNIQNGNDAVGLVIALEDPLTTNRSVQAGVVWPKPAQRAPWLKKLAEAIR